MCNCTSKFDASHRPGMTADKLTARSPSLPANGSRDSPDDRLLEAIHLTAQKERIASSPGSSE
jgi:hypothetical protein